MQPASLIAAMSVACAVTWAVVGRVILHPNNNPHRIILGATTVSMLHALSFVAASGEPDQTVVVIIWMLGTSGLVLHPPSLMTMLLLGYACWWGIAAEFEPTARLHWGINMTSSTVLAMVLGASRIRLFRDLAVSTEDALTARDEALRAGQAKTEFLATVSHELRTPLNAIVVGAELLGDSEDATTVRIAARRLHQRVRDLLDLSQLERTHPKLTLETFDLHALMSEISSMFGPRAEAKGLELRLVYESVPRFVKGDEGRVAQILGILTDNAIKFTDRGSVALTTRYDDGQVTFEVRDTGIGMSNDQLERAFTPFVQAPSANRDQEGVGLGLAIARRLIDAHHSTIHVESAVDRGTGFLFTLPLPATEAPRPSPMATITTGRLLVVEDHPVNRAVAARLLQVMGHTVKVVPSGPDALTVLGSEEFSAVFMDCQMPGMDGLQTTRAIRRQEPDTRRVPIIALTATATSSHRARCLEAGMDDFITKPMRREAVQQVLCRWLRPGGAPATSGRPPTPQAAQR